MTDDQLTYDSDRLIREWRDRYTDRRTVARQMLDEAEVLVRDAVARELEQQARAATQERDWDLERREQRLEHAERLHQSRIDHLRRELAEAKQQIASLSPRATLMREERETVEDGTVVRLLAPTVPNYGDGSSPRPWMLGELEDVIHRLRMAGGDERTEVRFKRDAIEACVPFAEFALTPPASTPTSQATTDHGVDVATRVWSPVRLAAAAALVALVITALAVIL